MVPSPRGKRADCRSTRAETASGRISSKPRPTRSSPRAVAKRGASFEIHVNPMEGDHCRVMSGRTRVWRPPTPRFKRAKMADGRGCFANQRLHGRTSDISKEDGLPQGGWTIRLLTVRWGRALHPQWSPALVHALRGVAVHGRTSSNKGKRVGGFKGCFEVRWGWAHGPRLGAIHDRDHTSQTGAVLVTGRRGRGQSKSTTSVLAALQGRRHSDRRNRKKQHFLDDRGIRFEQAKIGVSSRWQIDPQGGLSHRKTSGWLADRCSGGPGT